MAFLTDFFDVFVQQTCVKEVDILNIDDDHIFRILIIKEKLSGAATY